MLVFKLLNKVRRSDLDQQLLKMAGELDFEQSVVDLVSLNDDLNLRSKR